MLKEVYPHMEVASTCTDWQSGLATLRQSAPDLVFMDINMPQKSGLELLSYLPALKSEIIFVTAYPDYALDALDFSPSGYVLKPVREAKLVKAVDKALERVDAARGATAGKPPTSSNDRIAIPNDKGLDYIAVKDILYFEALSRYTRVVCTDRKVLSSYNIGKFKELVSDTAFFSAHRSYIINLNYVKRYESTGIIIMSDGTEVPLSRSVRDEFLNLFGRLS